MEKKSLYIYKLDEQGNKVKFPNSDMPSKLGEYTYSAQRMAGTPTLTATLNYPSCLDDFWSGEEFVEFRGEKYYVDQIPTSSKDNKSIMYKHELQFVSERIVLENVYFMDVVTDGADTYHSNSTSVKFMGDIHEFVGRLNASMTKSGIGYSVVIDDDITSDSKLVSLDNVYLADALQSIYTIYELPYYFVGKVCHIGYTENVISTPFEYRKGFVSIKKTNANYKIVNRVTGVGSSDNIPFYYPNDDETGTIERSQNLMPSIYRESGGAERFYNALNNKYKIPGTNDYYSFKNTYSAKKVKEIKVDFSDIKPTIEGVTNDSGQLFGEIADIAFDANDSDELGTGEGNNVFNGTDEYVHSYFYIKLHIYNGDYGFNLFEQGLEGGTAVINMTTGNCAACEFEIGVTYKEGEKRAYNPVLVDSNGNLLAGDFEQKVTPDTSKYVARQQNTSTNEVWISVKKDNSSFGVVMPNATNNYRPSVGDKFVITGIKMPKSLVLAAEKRLEEALIKYMSENNDEKFMFSVNFSRVFLAENTYLWDILNENARIYIKYNNREYLMYVNSYTCKADKNCLYDISVELTDKLSANVSALRSTISEIAGDIIGNTLGGANNNNDWFAKAARRFIRKDTNDRTPFKLEVGDKLTAEKGLQISKNFVSGIIGGSGGYIYLDENGKVVIETDKAVYREEIITPKITFNCIDVISGDKANTFAYGTIKTVDTENRIAALDLLEGQYGTLHVSDICRGVFHNIGGGNTDKDTIGANGFIEYSGFATSYFTPTNILENEAGIMKFEYELQVGTSVHPMPGMNFFAYGNFTDEDRQDITYENRYYTRRITHVNNWVIDPETNIEMQVGKLNGLSIGGMDFSGYSFYGKNVYISGTIERLKPNGTPAKDLSYEGAWESGRKYDYYDSVTHDGSTWACMNKNGSSAEPGTNNDWQKIASKGDPGESAVFADLTNEMDNVALTNDGKVYQDTSIGTVVWMSYGSKKMTLTDITCTLPANVTETHDVSTGEITFSVKQGVALDGRNPIPVALTATYNGKTYTGQLTFTLAGVKGGADAVLYRLVPSVSAVIKDANGNLNVTSVSCTRLKSSVSGGTAETGTGDLKYSLDGGSEVSIGNNAGVPVSSFQKSIKFIFYVDGTVVDVETIPLVVDGAQGPQGVPGPAGDDGKTLYTWIKYADNAQGGGISNNPTGKAYIGFAYNKETATESNNPSDYTWSDIKGEDGIPGATGADGKTYYTWVAYSDNADGTGMYQQPKDTTKYIGIAVNKETATESNNPSDYTWSKFKGEDGQSVSSLGRWYTGLFVPKLSIVTMGGSSFCSKKDTTNPPLWTTTTSDGRRILQTQNGGRTYGYILSGESNTEEYDLLVQSGKDGSDGKGYEYIFKSTTTNTRPATPATSQTDDYIPSGWHDDPIGVSESLPFEWISERKKRNGIWSNFSTPALWAKYGFDGIDGAEGVAGTSIVWKGDFSSAPSSPQNGWAYKNTTDKKSYVYQDGQWYQMTIDGIDGKNGKDGLSIVWKGDLQSPPSNPQINWAYRDTNNGRVYIWNGTAWSLMVVDGSDGADGAAGSNGLSVFITYNDSISQPSVPTGNGTTGGWHTNATSGAIWMSQKVASSASDGTWGTPIKIKGDKGDSITAMGRWYTGLIVPKQGVVTMGGSSYIAKKETTNPPLWTVTTSSGQRIKQTQDGGKTYGYILSGEMNSAEYDLLASKGEDGKPGVDGKPGADGKPGEKGEQGIQGCITRHSEWAVGVTYRNDEALTSGTRYVDIAMIRNNAAIDGWDVYKCNTTHTSSESNKPGVSSSTWTKLSGVGPIYTSFIIAKNGSIDFFQGNQFLIKKDDGTVTAGLSGSIAGSKVRIWAGSATPDDAPFQVLESGKVICMNAEVHGDINATKGIFNNVNIESGTIAGFKISNNSISSIDDKYGNGAYDGGTENNSYSKSKFFLNAGGYDSAFLGFSATKKWVGIGLNCMPATTNMQVLGRFEDTGTSAYTYNKAGLYISIAGATTYDDSNVHGNSALYIPKGHITGFRRRFRRVSTSTTLTNMDSIVRLVNTAEITVTLPAGCEDGQEIWLCSGNEKKVNVAAASGDTITGSGGSFASNRWHIYIYDAHNRDWVYGYTNY